MQLPVPRKRGAKKQREGASSSAAKATPKGPVKAAAKGEGAVEKPSRRSVTVKTTLYLPQEISEGCRDAVIYLAGHPEYLTLTTLIENALRRELDRLKDRYTDGQPFPTRRRELRAGRPLGT